MSGEQGLVPAPAASSTRKYLRDDGSWQDVIGLTQLAIAPSVTQLEIFKQQNFI
jgi:hypothetical protein